MNHDSLNNDALRFAGRVGRLPNMPAFDKLGNSKHQSWELTFYHKQDLYIWIKLSKHARSQNAPMKNN